MDNENDLSSSFVSPTIHTVTPENPLVREIKNQLEDYKTKRSVRELSPTKAAQSIQHLAKAVEILVNNGDQALWNVFVEFFKENKDGVCAYRNVLQGICSVPVERLRGQTRFIAFIMGSLVRGGRSLIPQDKFFREIGKIDKPGDPVQAVKLYTCYKRSKGISQRF